MCTLHSACFKILSENDWASRQQVDAKLKSYKCVKYLHSCLTLCDPMDYSPPGSSVMGFSKQEYWSGLPFPSPRDLPDPGMEPVPPALAGRVFTTLPPGKPRPTRSNSLSLCRKEPLKLLSNYFFPLFCRGISTYLSSSSPVTLILT